MGSGIWCFFEISGNVFSRQQQPEWRTLGPGAHNRAVGAGSEGDLYGGKLLVDIKNISSVVHVGVG